MIDLPLTVLFINVLQLATANFLIVQIVLMIRLVLHVPLEHILTAPSTSAHVCLILSRMHN